MDIQIENKTMITTIYRLELTEADVAAILADPSKLQSQLRALRGQQARGRHGAKNIRLGGAKGPKAKAAGGGRLECPYCGKAGLSRMGLGVHIGFKHKDRKGQPAPGAGS